MNKQHTETYVHKKSTHKNMPGGKNVIASGRFQVKKVYFLGGNGEVKREQSQTCLDSAEQASHLKA